MTNKLQTLKPNECSCVACQQMCKTRPCWGTPEDIQKIVDAGYEDRLMKDFWGGGSDIETYIIAPACKGSESKATPFWPTKECTFFKDGKCELHDKGLKPLEGRLASCTEKTYKKEPTVHELVAKTWNSEQGKDLVKKFSEKYKIGERDQKLDLIEGMFGFAEVKKIFG